MVRMRFKTYCSLLILVLLSAKQVLCVMSYSDVAVVVNTRSGNSVAIGNYFRNARSIPEANMVYVNVDSAEEADDAVFRILRSQIEQQLVANNLVNSINYIVTTKGVPLKVNRGSTFSTTSPSSSVESELACMLGRYSGYIGQEGRITSPYYHQSVPFSRAEFGIYLVTRLDAYTVQQVFDMIDRSGPGVCVNASAAYVFDQDPDWNTSLPYLNSSMESAQQSLVARGKHVQLNSDTLYLTNRTNVIGYVSWGTNDHHAAEFTQHGIPHNSWVAGSIAETYVSTSGRSFDLPAEYGQSLIADVIQEGVSGAKGYVYEPYSSSMADASILFDAYCSGHNLAESYSMASSYLSWMDVIVGDPKTSIDCPASLLPVQLSSFRASRVGTERVIHLTWETLSENNNFGFTVQWSDTSLSNFVDIQNSFVPGHGTTLAPQSYSWIHRDVPAGTYCYRLRQVDMDGTEHFSEVQRASISTSADAHGGETPGQLELAQNYPNPFNPSTTISYQNPAPGRVTLRVFSESGEEVVTLVDRVQQPGKYSVSFAAGTLASSVYFYRVQTGNQMITRKMILLK